MHIKMYQGHQNVHVREVSHTVFEIIWRETCKIHLWVYVVVYKFSCKHGGDGVGTWTKFDGHIYPVIMQKYLPFITYCEVCCCLHVK